jgi:hypothetical protein
MASFYTDPDLKLQLKLVRLARIGGVYPIGQFEKLLPSDFSFERHTYNINRQ